MRRANVAGLRLKEFGAEQAGAGRAELEVRGRLAGGWGFAFADVC